MKLCCLSIINVKTTSQAFTFIVFQHRFWCTDATDFSMFSLAPMLPMPDVRCVNRPNSTGDQELRRLEHSSKGSDVVMGS